MRVSVSWLGLLGLGACQFDRPADVGEVDARVVDAAPTCTPDTITCADRVYTECGADGFPLRQLACPIDCAPDEPRCLDLDPHNGLAMYLDMVAEPPDVTLRGPATIDARTGAILDGGLGVVVPMFEGSLRIFVVRTLTVEGDLVVSALSTSTLPIAFVAQGDIVIRGRIDVSANGLLAGPGGHHSGNQSDTIACQGGESSGMPPQPSGGAGGGGGATTGGPGGLSSLGAGAPGGAADPQLEPLGGGCQGGYVYVNNDNVAWGGGGGGGLQLASRTQIRFVDRGSVDASGGGASAGTYILGGAGGGAGGSLLLEAPQVILDGPEVVVSTKGGGGSSAAGTSGGLPGADGGTEAAPALGGRPATLAWGGNGGGVNPPTGGADAAGGGASGGGGGGAAGTVGIYTRNGAVAPQNGAAIRGGLTTGVLRTRRVP